MAKDKKASKAAAPAPKPAVSKPLETVKESRVKKPADMPKAVARDAAKKAAKKVEKQSKKKEPTPEPSSESGVDSTSESSASSDNGSDSDAEMKPKANGTAKVAAAKKDESGSDDTSDASDSDDGGVAPKVNGKAAALSDSSDDGSDDSSEASDSGSDDEVEAKPGAEKLATDAKMDDESSSGSDSSDDEDEIKAPKAKTNGEVKADAADSSEASSDDEEDSDEGSDDDEEEVKPKVEAPANKKRKAEEAYDQTPKKTKVTVNGEEKDVTGNLFIGNLSWNVDEDWLTREFEEFGELKSVRIITDRDTGNSKGFGYVEFIETESGLQAFEAKNGAMLDGRNIRVDFSLPRQPRNEGQTPQQRSSDRAQRYGDVPKDPSTTLFVGNISFDVDQDMVSEYFQEYGTVNAVRLPTDRETGALKGFGYVEMGSLDESKAALEGLQGADVGGRAIRLDYAGERPSNNDSRGSFGGGRGGGRGRGGFNDRGGRGGGRGGFNDRGRGRGRGGFNDRGRGRGMSTNRGGFGDFSGEKKKF